MPLTRCLAILATVLSIPTVYGASLPLSPYPNRLEAGDGVFHVGARADIQVMGNADDDRFAASLLAGDLSTLDGVTVGAGADAARIVLARADSAEGRQILQASGLVIPPQADREGYVLIVTTRGASVVAKSSAGIFYGVQTLRQLFHPLPPAVSTPAPAAPQNQSNAVPPAAGGTARLLPPQWVRKPRARS